MKNIDSQCVNAQDMAKQHPNTFYAPSIAELQAIQVGNYVKICVPNERFWTIVQSINAVDDTITAKIDNDLIDSFSHGLFCGDIVTFKNNKIYDIME